MLVTSGLVQSAALGGCSMHEQTANLFVVEDLENAARTRELSESDLSALRGVADWTRTFVAMPHPDLGRAGPVCPFVSTGLDGRTLWLAPEQQTGRTTEDVIQTVERYKRLLLQAEPREGSNAEHKSISVVFTDLPASRAKEFFDAVLQPIGVSSYVDQGLVIGPFYEGNEGTAIYNPSFRPFTSPTPFLLMRPAVVSDWKFFLEDDAWLDRWARRHGDAAVRALAVELRRQPWRASRA
jgi:hypothetical protein